MKQAYLDCFSGISGDMTLGALVDAGCPVEHLRSELSGLRVPGWELSAEKVPSANARPDSRHPPRDRKSTRLNSSHSQISHAVFCLKKKINDMMEGGGQVLELNAKSVADKFSPNGFDALGESVKRAAANLLAWLNVEAEKFISPIRK